MKAPERFLVKTVREFCNENGLSLNVFSQGWLITINNNNNNHLIFGYDLGLNTSVAHQIANDKSATSDVLSQAGVPAVEHLLFHNPTMAEYVGQAGNWSRITEYFDRCGSHVVCKSHGGTGGNRVYRARTSLELEECVQLLFSGGRALTISPFIEIAKECRVVVLDGIPRLAYSKERPFVTGNGESTIAQLMNQQGGLGAPAERIAGARLDLSYVPAAGETIVTEWRHNLAHGGMPRLIEQGGEELLELAVQAANAIGLRFASVDIVQSDALRVLEINSGVMMESFAKSGPAHLAIAQDIYKSALTSAIFG